MKCPDCGSQDIVWLASDARTGAGYHCYDCNKLHPNVKKLVQDYGWNSDFIRVRVRGLKPLGSKKAGAKL